jgi:hypothetical protein
MGFAGANVFSISSSSNYNKNATQNKNGKPLVGHPVSVLVAAGFRNYNASPALSEVSGQPFCQMTTTDTGETIGLHQFSVTHFSNLLLTIRANAEVVNFTGSVLTRYLSDGRAWDDLTRII